MLIENSFSNFSKPATRPQPDQVTYIKVIENVLTIQNLPPDPVTYIRAPGKAKLIRGCGDGGSAIWELEAIPKQKNYCIVSS